MRVRGVPDTYNYLIKSGDNILTSTIYKPHIYDIDICKNMLFILRDLILLLCQLGWYNNDVNKKSFYVVIQYMKSKFLEGFVIILCTHWAFVHIEIYHFTDHERFQYVRKPNGCIG